jgi:hypothetical protein
MKEITIAVGSKENLSEDIQAVARQFAAEPKIVIAAGKEKDIRNTVIDHASNLFLDENTVLVVVDPPASLIDELKGQLEVLKEKIPTVIFSTVLPIKSSPTSTEGVALEQDKEKR